MKKMLITLAAFALMGLNLDAFADKLVIVGNPVAVEKQGDVYAYPDNTTATAGYYFVTLNGERKVCYTTANPDLATLNAATINLRVAGTTYAVHCYLADPNYFTFQAPVVNP